MSDIQPTGWVASGPPIIVTPDPSDQMSVDVPVTLFTNTNPDGVIPGATVPSTFTVGSEPAHITAVVAYHYVMPDRRPDHRPDQPAWPRRHGLRPMGDHDDVLDAAFMPINDLGPSAPPGRW